MIMELNNIKSISSNNMLLSCEQQIVYNKYIEGKNVFITGPGGSGKSEIIRKIYENALSKNKKIQVTALTGCAAVLLGCKAKTIHSWSGIGLGNGSIYSNICKITNSFYKKKIWKEIDILIIDEISMMSLKLFDMLNEIGKTIRKNSKPFGGIQVIFSGDFYQLPPVGDDDDVDTSRFCFESEEWNNVFQCVCQVQLVKIFRQNDDVYASILNQIRQGKIKRKSCDLLMQYVGRKIDEDIIVKPTKLFPTRSKVDFINNTEMQKIEGSFKEYKIKQNIDLPLLEGEVKQNISTQDRDRELNFIQNNLMCENILRLKIGAQVMCIVNMETPCGRSLCNGSQGIVMKFNEVNGLPIVKFNNGVEITMSYYVWRSENIPGIGISQIPLILSWALTIHKSQGSSLDTAEIDVGSGIFEAGQTYVALSRVKSLNGLYLSSFDINKITINKKVKLFYEKLDITITEKEKK